MSVIFLKLLQYQPVCEFFHKLYIMQDNYIGITLCNFLAYSPFRNGKFLSHLKVSFKDPRKEDLNISVP
jgi:hypothetical protein